MNCAVRNPSVWVMLGLCGFRWVFPPQPGPHGLTPTQRTHYRGLVWAWAAISRRPDHTWKTSPSASSCTTVPCPGALPRGAQLRPKPAPGLQQALCFHPSPGLTEHQGTEKFPHADLNPSHLGTSRRAAGTRLAEPAPAQAKGTGLHLPSADVRACCHQEGMQCGVLAIPPRLHSGEDQ